jgi:hypothetical protein
LNVGSILKRKEASVDCGQIAGHAYVIVAAAQCQELVGIGTVAIDNFTNGKVSEPRMNRWNIPKWLEQAVKARDTACIYCGVDFMVATTKRGAKPSWEHIINNASIVTLENIALCCISCNASKGAKDLIVWLTSHYCSRKDITRDSVASVVKNALAKSQTRTS